MLKSTLFVAILDDETRATEGTEPSTDDVGIAKDDDNNNNTARNLAEVENCSSGQANGDIEMEDDNVDRNIQLPNDDGQETLNSAETNANNKESTSLPLAKESVEPEDIEMTNTETAGLDNTTDSTPQNENVPETERSDINGTTEENDLLGSVKDLPPNEDDEDLVTAPLSQDTPSSEALHQEEPQETLAEGPTETAPSENEPSENQNAEMETE